MDTIRFSVDGYRFTVKDNTVAVYERVDNKRLGISTEHNVSPQKRTAMIAKYKDHIAFARERLWEDI